MNTPHEDANETSSLRTILMSWLLWEQDQTWTIQPSIRAHQRFFIGPSSRLIACVSGHQTEPHSEYVDLGASSFRTQKLRTLCTSKKHLASLVAHHECVEQSRFWRLTSPRTYRQRPLPTPDTRQKRSGDPDDRTLVLTPSFGRCVEERIRPRCVCKRREVLWERSTSRPGCCRTDWKSDGCGRGTRVMCAGQGTCQIK